MEKILMKFSLKKTSQTRLQNKLDGNAACIASSYKSIFPSDYQFFCHLSQKDYLENGFFQYMNVCRYRLYNNNSFSHFSCISCIWCKSFLFCILYISLIYILCHVSHCKLFFENSTTFIKSRKSIRAYQTEILLNFPKQRKICVTKKKQDLCLLAKYLFRVIWSNLSTLFLCVFFY